MKLACVLCVALLAVSPPLRATSTQARCSGTFDGVWDTLYGKLSIAVGTGGQVQATWVKKDLNQPWGPDIISASLQGTVLRGRYTNDWNKAEGDFEFHLAADGHSFTGGWTMTNHGGGAGGGPWPGTCVPTEDLRTRDKGPTPPPPTRGRDPQPPKPDTTRDKGTRPPISVTGRAEGTAPQVHP